MSTNSKLSLKQTIELLEANLDNLSFGEKQQLLELTISYNMERARTEFAVFVRLMAPLVLPDPFEEGPHIWLMAKELQEVEEATRIGKKKRLQISLPPRGMKTVLLNIFIAWCFGRNPTWKVMHISHTQGLIEDISGGPIKDIINMPEYQAIFPGTQLRKDARAKNRWMLTSGGIYACFGTNQNLAGRGANLVVVDDAMSEQTAISKVEREKVNNLYAKGVRSRIWKMGSEICVGTRWRVDDLLGFLQKLDGTQTHPVPGSKFPWKIIAIPAILDAPASRILGLPVGSSFWPGVKSIDELEDLRRSNSESDWRALYLQAPVIEEGNLFKSNMFVWLNGNDPPNNIKYIIVAMDTAFSTKETADFSAITVYGLFDRVQILSNGREKNVTNVCLLDFELGRWSFPDLAEKAQALNDAFQPDLFVVEAKASGQSLIQELVRRGIPVTGYSPDRDKISRAHAVTPIHLAKRVWFPKLKFAQELYEELKAFPNQSHDDAVDAHVLALTWLKDSYEVTNDNYASEKAEDHDPMDEKNYFGRGKASSYWGAASGAWT